MKKVLIYSTQPEYRPLTFVNDVSDVAGVIEAKLGWLEAVHNGKVEEAQKVGGEVSSLGLTRWRNAKWVEVEVE